MLPRWCLISSPLVLILLSLVSLWTRATSLENTLTVNLTNAAARNGRVTAPEVCRVMFRFPSDYSIIEPDQTCISPTDNMEEKSCTLNRTDSSLNVTFKKEDSEDTFTFNVTFDPTMEVSCSNYLPNTLVVSPDSAVFICTPVYSCSSSLNESTSLESVQWRRFATFDDLDSSNFKKVKTEEGIANVTGEKLELILTAARHEVVGFYVPNLNLSGLQDRKNGQYFVVYLDPELDESSGDEEVIFGSDEARDFRKIFCRFASFPPANITMSWDAPTGSSFTTEDTGDPLKLGGEDDPTLTRGGRLVFKKVQYEDGGRYRCNAENPVSGVTTSSFLRLRVRDPLRPLWPALGIIGSFLITAVFIFGGVVVDRIRGKQATEDDDGAFQRNYSIVSNLGEESGSCDSRRPRKKHQSVGKRTSITQQELLTNASDPN